jgi:anti-anti-sigma factor
VNEAHIRVARSDGDQLHLAVSGDIDLANAPTVEGELAAAIPNLATAVELDLGDVSYLDSAGLHVLFALTVKLRRLQIGLRIRAPEGSPARHAIEMAGMGSIAHIDPTPS